MKTAVVLRHATDEGLGVYERVLREQNYAVSYIDGWQRSIDVEAAHTADLLMILGGPMGVYEADVYPFLKVEIGIIRHRLVHRKALFGVCLGSQLIANAAGSRVYPAREKEIGYAPVTLTDAGRASCLAGLAEVNFMALHWHGDTFDLPPKAVRLASTSLTANQAFSLGHNVLALQFHIEVLPADLEAWAAASPSYLAAAGVALADLRAAARTHCQPVANAGARIFTNWLRSIG